MFYVFILKTLAALTLVLGIMVFIDVVSDLNKKGETYWQAAFLGPIIEILTMVRLFL